VGLARRTRRLEAWLFLGIILLASITRFAAALRRPLYVDEGLSLTVSALPIGQELAFLRFDFHPPLFFLALHALESASAPIWLLRCAVVVCGLASIALLVLIVRLWSTPRAALIAGTAAALMPSLAFYDTWLRMYSLLGMLQLAAFSVLSLLVRQPLERRRRLVLWAAWAALNAAALYTHYLAIISLAAQLAFVLVMRRSLIFETLLSTAAALAVWPPQFPPNDRPPPVSRNANGGD